MYKRPYTISKEKTGVNCCRGNDFTVISSSGDRGPDNLPETFEEEALLPWPVDISNDRGGDCQICIHSTLTAVEHAISMDRMGLILALATEFVFWRPSQKTDSCNLRVTEN